MLNEQHENLISEVRKNAHYKQRLERLEALLLPGGEREALWQLFMNGPTWDGDIISKSARDTLFDRKFADRVNGWSFLTKRGTEVALAMAMDREKERRQRSGNMHRGTENTADVVMAATKDDRPTIDAFQDGEACDHVFSGWRAFPDGNGGEQVCSKCGMGAMAHTLRQ